MEGDKTGVFLELYDPTGTIDIAEVYAPRLDDLKGKTICELSNSMWEDFRTFPFIRKVLQDRFPDMKIIPYTEMPDIYGVETEVLAGALKEKGCDGAIVGNAA